VESHKGNHCSGELEMLHGSTITPNGNQVCSGDSPIGANLGGKLIAKLAILFEALCDDLLKLHGQDSGKGVFRGRSLPGRVRHTRRSRQYEASPPCCPTTTGPSAMRRVGCDELS
jgi:hypothetical protein